MKLIAGLAVTLAIFFVGAGISALAPHPQDEPGSASIVLDDYHFAPNRIDARVGEPITLQLTNAGSQRHDLDFPSLHMPGLEGAEAILDPGETRAITLVFDQPGTHTFVCLMPGHEAAGMTGAVYVAQ